MGIPLSPVCGLSAQSGGSTVWRCLYEKTEIEKTKNLLKKISKKTKKVKNMYNFLFEKKFNLFQLVIAALAGGVLALGLVLFVPRTNAQDGPTMVLPPSEWLDGTNPDPWVLEGGEVPDFSQTEFHADAEIEAIVWGHTFRGDPEAVTYLLERDGSGGSLYLFNNVEVAPPQGWGESDATREFVVGRVQATPPISEWGQDLEKWVFDVSANGVAFENLTAEQAHHLLQVNDGGSTWKWLKSDKIRFCAFIPTAMKSD